MINVITKIVDKYGITGIRRAMFYIIGVPGCAVCYTIGYIKGVIECIGKS